MIIAGWILLVLLTVYEWILLIRAILSWVQVINPQWTPHGVILLIAEGSYTVTDPPLRFLRKLIKPLRLGHVSFDMAFMVLFVLILVGLRVVQWVFF
jgi:YggT family protein